MENKVSIDPLLECYINIIRNLTTITNEIVISSSHKNTDSSNKLKNGVQEYINLLVNAQSILSDSSLSKEEIPLGFIKHIDEGKSPNTWLMDLFKLLDEQNDRARGEAFTLSSLHRAISKRLLIGRDLSMDDIAIINRKL
ncbi:Transcription factor subunit Med10 of Mediator complex [Cryptosporidium tyzzeri]|nr:Transcription factor subunit Med10 of Mediator complex [Cryptosporidium tyzzeri]